MGKGKLNYGIIFIILSCIVIILESIRCVMAYRARGWSGISEELKGFIDDYKWIFYMMFAIYTFVVMQAMTGMIENWANTQNIQTVGVGYTFVLKGIPIMWRLFSVYVLFRIIYSGFKPAFKHKKLPEVIKPQEQKVDKKSFRWANIIKYALRKWK